MLVYDITVIDYVSFNFEVAKFEVFKTGVARIDAELEQSDSLIRVA